MTKNQARGAADNNKEERPDIEIFAKIKVVGVGGSGGAAIDRMMAGKIRGVELIVINTDVQALHQCAVGKKLHIGKNITRGLGTGMNSEIGLKAAEETVDQIRKILEDADMVFITCGLGGGTGTGASPLIAKVARKLGALTVAVVTKPFSFEGAQRQAIAEQGLDKLSEQVDAIITIPNDRILQIIDKQTSLLEAFMTVDEVLKNGIKAISEIVTVPGLINVDLADVKAVMHDAGSALMGTGEASGENRAIKAAKIAIDSPLLEHSIEGAGGIIFTIAGDKDLSMNEVNEAAKVITSSADEDAKIIFGAMIDESLKDKVKITVVATSFGNGPRHDKAGAKMKFTSSSSSAQPVATVKKESLPKPRVFKFAEEIKKKEEEELAIPAFIRKKMM